VLLLLLLRCLLVLAAAAAVPWRFIDLLPLHAGKGAAMQHVMQHYGFDAASTVAAGDSANDLLMLKQVGWHLIRSWFRGVVSKFVYMRPCWLAAAPIVPLLVVHSSVHAHSFFHQYMFVLRVCFCRHG
jgi:hypothetical protein